MSLVFLFAMKNLSDQALTNLCQGLRDTANLWWEISAVNGNYCVRTDVTLQMLATHNQTLPVEVSVSLSLRFQNTFPEGGATLSSHTDTNSFRLYQQSSRFGSPWILIGNKVLAPEQKQQSSFSVLFYLIQRLAIKISMSMIITMRFQLLSIILVSPFISQLLSVL